MKLFAKLEKQKDTWFVLITSFIFFLLRLPSLYEPLWYGDEGIYEVIGKALRTGRLLYRDIWDNKPPLLYTFYALVNGNQFGAKLLSLLVGIATVIAFFFLARMLLFNKKEKHTTRIPLYIATLLFMILFGLPLLEGNIANAENFMLLPIILAGLLSIKSLKKASYTLFFAGFLLGIAFLIKTVAVFDFAALGFILFTMSYTKLSQLKKPVFSLIALSAGFFAPLFITIVYFWSQGALHDFIISTFLSNIGYVGYANTFIIPQGLLIIKLFFLVFALCILFYKRQTFSFSGIYIYTWLAFSLFNMFFSQRPYTHYALVLTPSFCLLIGYAKHAYSRNKWHTIGALLCVIGVLVHFSIHWGSLGKTMGYYQNFIAFLTKKIDRDSYYRFFDPATIRDTRLAQFFITHKGAHERTFIWGNNGQLYLLLHELPPGKYIVAYHMTFTKSAWQETKSMLMNVKPTSLIILPNQPTIPYDLKNYIPRFSLNGATLYSIR